MGVRFMWQFSSYSSCNVYLFQSWTKYDNHLNHITSLWYSPRSSLGHFNLQKSLKLYLPYFLMYQLTHTESGFFDLMRKKLGLYFSAIIEGSKYMRPTYHRRQQLKHSGQAEEITERLKCKGWQQWMNWYPIANP